MIAGTASVVSSRLHPALLAVASAVPVVAVSAHPRMGTIYQKYFDVWTDAGGDLFCYFSSVGRWSKWDRWGIMQHYDDQEARSPKFMATMKWAGKCGQKVNLPE